MENLVAHPLEKLDGRALAAPSERLHWKEPRFEASDSIAKEHGQGAATP
jgi:hypothetical protein